MQWYGTISVDLTNALKQEIDPRLARATPRASAQLQFSSRVMNLRGRHGPVSDVPARWIGSPCFYFLDHKATSRTPTPIRGSWKIWRGVRWDPWILTHAILI